MADKDKKPYGYIYRATNIQNGKVYIGQTVTGRWKENQNPIEERWKEECGEAYRKKNRGEHLRAIENAIIKYGPENFKLEEQEKAYNQEDLDEKETKWIREKNTMVPEGYNLKEGGLGGRLSEFAKEHLSNVISEKWQEDEEYQEKQIKERRERANDPEWLDKMANVNQKIARNPETQEKMSESLKEKWQDEDYQENVSKGISNKWQEEKYRERQFQSRSEGKREFPDNREFLKDIQEMKKKDINKKYDMDGKCINRRIKEMLGHKGIKNYSEAKKYLEDKNLNDVLKDINHKRNTESPRGGVKKEISDKRQFLEDIQNMKSREIEQKYNMNRTTINKRIHEMLGDQGIRNYAEAKKYLEDKNLDNVIQRINENLEDRSKTIEGKTVITDKPQFLEDIKEMKKKDINLKYGMDGKTINRRISEMLGPCGVKNYSEAKEPSLQVILRISHYY